MKKIVSIILVCIIIGSAFLPGYGDKVKVEAAQKKTTPIVLGECNQSLCVKKAKNKVYTYSTSNKKIVSVNKTGKMTALKKGKVTVKRFKYSNGVKKLDKSCKVKVVGIQMNLPKKIYTDNAYVFSGNSKKMKWKSSNPAVLTISEDGKVITNKAGSTRLTAQVGKKKVVKTVTVFEDMVTALSAKYEGDMLGKGEYLDAKKIRVEAVFVSGKQSTVTDFGVDFKRSDILGEHVVTVSYGGKQAACIVRVVADSVATVAGMNVTHKITDIVPQYKGTWYLDQGMDLEKLKFVVTYSDGSQEEIAASDVKVLTTVNEEGRKEVLLSYKINGVEYTSVLYVDVTKRTPVALELVNPNKDPIEGDDINPSDYIVTVIYDDDSRKVVDNWGCEQSKWDKAGDVSLIINYEEGGISIKQAVPVHVEKLMPTKMYLTNVPKSIIEGEDIDYTGMKVVVEFNNGQEAIIPKGQWESDFNKELAVVGENKVNICYKEIQESFVIVVKHVSVVSITATNPSASTPVGCELNKTGIKVTAKYDDGTSKVVTGWSHDYAPHSVPGDTNAVITYGGKQCSIAVVVSAGLHIQANTGGTIAGHKVIVSSNYADVSWSIVNGGHMASLSQSSGNEVTLATVCQSEGWVTVRGKRQSTGEIQDVSVGLVPYRMVMTSAGNIALGDSIRYDTNGNSNFQYTLVDGGTVIQSGRGNDGLAFVYTSSHVGDLTVTATDIESGETITIGCVVRKALNIEGPNSVSVGKKITLKTSKNVVSWSSSNTSVATVSATGIVTGKKKGTVTIVATFPEYANRTVSKSITVK